MLEAGFTPGSAGPARALRETIAGAPERKGEKSRWERKFLLRKTVPTA